jgi:hypothetical protein
MLELLVEDFVELLGVLGERSPGVLEVLAHLDHRVVELVGDSLGPALVGAYRLQ